MRAVLWLVLVPAWRSWLSTGFIALLVATGVAIAVALHDGDGGLRRAGIVAAVAMAGMAAWFWHILLGAAWSNVLRADLRLLPYYRPRVYGALALSLALWLLPCAVALIAAGLSWPVTLGVLLLVCTVGFCAGLGASWASWVWLVFPLLGLIGDQYGPLVRGMLSSPWLPLLPCLLAALALRLTLPPRLAATDETLAASPFDQSINDRRTGMQALAESGNRNALARALGRGIGVLVEWSSQPALKALERRRDSPWRRWRAMRALLLPYEQLPVVLVQGVLLSLLLLIVLPAFAAGKRAPGAGLAMGYAVLLAVSRFANLHRAVLLLRPSTTDAYFALGADDAHDFQARFAWGLLSSVLSALVFGGLLLGLIVLGLRPPDVRAFLGAGFTAIAASSLFALGLVLMSTDSRKVRPLLFALLTTLAALACSMLSWGLFHHYRFERALAIASFGLVVVGTFTASGYRDMVSRRPVFDPPQ